MATGPNWPLLTALASAKVGERVLVSPLAPEQKGVCSGLSGWDGSAYTIELDADLAREPSRLLETWAHEVAHLALGHVGKAAPSWSPAHAAAVAAMVTPEIAADAAKSRAAKERDADQWAASWLAEWSPIERWALALALAGGG